MLIGTIIESDAHAIDVDFLKLTINKINIFIFI